MKQREQQLNIKNKASRLVLIAVLVCSPTFAQSNLSNGLGPLEFTPQKSIKLINPMYLDPTQSKNPAIKIKTSVPYTGDFNESDYFSSSIGSEIEGGKSLETNESRQLQVENTSLSPTGSGFADGRQNFTPSLRERSGERVNLPQNSINEYPANNFFAPPVAQTELQIKTPQTPISESFFAPPQKALPESQENTQEVHFTQMFQNVPAPSEFKPTKNANLFEPPKFETTTSDTEAELQPVAETKPELRGYEGDDVYSAGVGSYSEVDLTGKLVTDVIIEGVKTLDPKTISSTLKTQVGTLFNEALIQEDLQTIYSTGYFTDRMAVEPSLKEDGTVELKYLLQENLLVTDVAITGNTVISAMELMPMVMQLKNYPQNIENINQAIDKLSEYYHSKGYILAGVSSVDDEPDGTLVFTMSEGIIDKILIEGNEKTKDYVIERNIMTQPGTVYNENYLKEDLARVYSTKIFKEVDREIFPSDTVEGEYNLKVVVKEDSSNNFTLGGGIDNGLGAFGSIGFNENNFGGRGQRLSLNGILGSGILLSDASIKNRMNYQLELSFFEPHFLNADNSLMSKLYYRDLGSWQVPLAIERRFGLNATVEHKVKNNDKLSTTFSTGIEHISLSEGDYNKVAHMYALRNLDISQRAKQLSGGLFFNFAPGIKYSTLDTEENPRNGYIAQAKFMESLSLDNFNKHTTGRLAGSITRYFPVLKKSSLALTARGGVKVHGDEMPEVMAFRLGGPYSIRGFRMSGVGTGDSFLMGSAELATPLPFADKVKWDFFQKIRFTFFVDAGKVFDPTIGSILYDRPMSAITAGIGLKVFVPGVGPISVDYGIPLTNPGEYGSKNGYFTFGTAGMNGYGW